MKLVTWSQEKISAIEITVLRHSPRNSDEKIRVTRAAYWDTTVNRCRKQVAVTLRCQPLFEHLLFTMNGRQKTKQIVQCTT